MSEQLDPIGFMNRQTQPAASNFRGHEFVLTPQPPQQEMIGRPTSLDTMLRALHEPALLHQQGRITALNAALRELLAHPCPDRLIGLPADALLDHVGPHGRGLAAQAVLHRALGPVPVSLSILDIELSDGAGTLWIFGPPTATTQDLTNRAARSLEDYCDHLWHRSTPGQADLLKNLTEVIDLLQPPDDDAVRVSVDLAEAMGVIGIGGQLDVTRSGRVDTSPEALAHLLTAMMAGLADDARVRVDVDVSGRPLVVVRRAYGSALPATSIQAAQVLATGLSASVISLDGGRVVRLRLPAAPALPTPSQTN